MPVRKSTGKKQRFDIFKRDKFTCQYCGRNPPTVSLVVDHILPVAKGGETVPHNLITSCTDCNQGKAAGLLTEVPRAIDSQLAEQVERHEQLVAYNRFLATARKREFAAAEKIGTYWNDVYLPQDKRGTLTFGTQRLRSAATFVRRLPETKIYEAIDIATGKIRNDENKAFLYFCGICWKMIRDAANG